MSGRQLRLLLLLIIAFVCTAAAAGGNTGNTVIENVTHLIQQVLLKDQNPDIPPWGNNFNTVNVSVSFTLRNFLSVDALSQTMSIVGWLTLTWPDASLSWDRTVYPIPEVSLPSCQVWVPEIVVVNSRGGLGQVLAGQTLVRVNSSGHVTWRPRLVVDTTCFMGSDFYPTHTDTCSVDVAAWQDLGEWVNLSFARPGFDMSSTDLKQWEWTLVRTELHYQYLSPTAQHRVLSFTFIVKRQFLVFTLGVILPITFMSQIYSLVFLLPIRSGEKVTLPITYFEVFTFVLVSMYAMSPKNMNGAYLIGVLLTLQLITNTAILYIVAITMACFKGDYNHLDGEGESGTVLGQPLVTKGEMSGLGSRPGGRKAFCPWPGRCCLRKSGSRVREDMLSCTRRFTGPGDRRGIEKSIRDNNGRRNRDSDETRNRDSDKARNADSGKTRDGGSDETRDRDSDETRCRDRYSSDSCNSGMKNRDRKCSISSDRDIDTLKAREGGDNGDDYFYDGESRIFHESCPCGKEVIQKTWRPVCCRVVFSSREDHIYGWRDDSCSENSDLREHRQHGSSVDLRRTHGTGKSLLRATDEQAREPHARSAMLHCPPKNHTLEANEHEENQELCSGGVKQGKYSDRRVENLLSHARESDSDEESSLFLKRQPSGKDSQSSNEIRKPRDSFCNRIQMEGYMRDREGYGDRLFKPAGSRHLTVYQRTVSSVKDSQRSSELSQLWGFSSDQTKKKTECLTDKPRGLPSERREGETDKKFIICAYRRARAPGKDIRGSDDSGALHWHRGYDLSCFSLSCFLDSSSCYLVKHGRTSNSDSGEERISPTPATERRSCRIRSPSSSTDSQSWFQEKCSCCLDRRLTAKHSRFKVAEAKTNREENCNYLGAGASCDKEGEHRRQGWRPGCLSGLMVEARTVQRLWRREGRLTVEEGQQLSCSVNAVCFTITIIAEAVILFVFIAIVVIFEDRR